MRRRSAVDTLGGMSFTCIGVSECTIEVDDCVASLEMLVVPGKPMNFDLILGINAIRALGGVCIFGGGIMFGNRGCLRRQCAAGQQLKEEKPGYSIEFDSVSNRWTCKYNWIGGVEPVTIPNRISQYNVPDDARQDFDKEIELWIENKWLVPYNEQRYGPARCLLPLMAARQANKNKVSPVLDFRALNCHVDSYTADADVCQEKLREWRRKSDSIYLIDLTKAYLQIAVHESLWPYQTVRYNGQLFCLTRLGFGLNAAPAIMQAVVAKVLALNDLVSRGSSAYVDDVIVDGDIVSPAFVKEHLAAYGLMSKDIEKVSHGARVLGLKVSQSHDGVMTWSRDNELPVCPQVVSRRNVFSMCGKLV